MLRKFWFDPVWSRVIATGIVAIAGWAVVYFAGWWPALLGAGGTALAFMGGATSVANWLLTLLALCAISVVVVIVAIAWSAIFQSQTRLLSFKSYTEDDFFGIHWRWRYDGNAPYGIVSFCPNCDLQLDPVNVGAYHAVDHIAIRCNDCEITWGEFEMSRDELQNRMERRIHQKLRAGTWQEVVQRMLEKRVGSGQ
jgi:hypothetical protein